MSSSIGLSAVILGCFGSAWAAVRQQIGLLIASYPCCIRRHTLLAVFDCEPSCTLSTFRAFRGCCLSVWRFPKAEPTNHPKAFYLPMVRSCLLARGWLGQGGVDMLFELATTGRIIDVAQQIFQIITPRLQVDTL